MIATRFKTIIFSAAVLLICASISPAENKLSQQALENTLFTLDGDGMSLESALSSQDGEIIFIDFWASWCKDCIAGFPKVKNLQSEYPDITFLFLSVDKEDEKWRNGIEKFGLDGSHYRIDGGWKSELCTFIELDWIPRYMILDRQGNVLHFKSILADDSKLKKKLNKLTN